MKKFVIVFVVLLLGTLPSITHAAAGDTLSGYAWSSTTGWLSMNCTNSGICGTSNYGVTTDASGVLTGYAWSSNVGWVSFNAADISGCPSGTCTAQLNQSTGKVTGWARAIAGEDADTSHTGGWGGWIHLSGTNYGVLGSAPAPTNCAWSGYAWGGGPDADSGIVGWLNFGPTAGFGGVIGTGTACVTTPVVTCIADHSSPVDVGTTVTYTAQPVNSGSPYSWEDKNGNPLSGSGITKSITYGTTGDYQPQVAATKSGGGLTAYGQCPDILVQPAGDCGGSASGGVLTASPTRVATSSTSKLSWTSVTGEPKGTTCSIVSTPSGNSSGVLETTDNSCDTGNDTSPWTSGPINTQTKFCYVCGSDIRSCAVVDVTPTIQEN